MAHLVKGGAQLLLDRRGEVVPYALRLLGKNADPKTCFPKDQNPNASFEELFERAVAWAREERPSVSSKCSTRCWCPKAFAGGSCISHTTSPLSRIHFG